MILDKISVGRRIDCYCGASIAFDFVRNYIEEHIDGRDIKGTKILVISDRNVGGYYYSRFEKQFLAKEVRPELTIVDAGNSYKNLSSVAEVIRAFVDFEFGDGDWVIALGGGGVLDVASFATGIYAYDVNLVNIPTTMGAMVEGSVGRNSLINAGSHKNIIMGTSEPKVIFADPDFLGTVPQKVRTNGYAVVIKYAVLQDPTLLKELLDTSDLRAFLGRVYETRAAIEALNPKLLNLGIELSDAIEGYFRFMNYSEGEALALSIYAAVPEKYREVLKVLYNKLGLPRELSGVQSKMIIKKLEENIRKHRNSKVEVVDLELGKWVLKTVTCDEAVDIQKKRIGIICAE